LVVDNAARSTSKLDDNTVALAIFGNNTQSITYIADNVAQSTSALVDSNATTTEVDDALTINSSAASLLNLTQAVRKTNVPSFICQYICI
jgi:hypothetical protein